MTASTRLGKTDDFVTTLRILAVAFCTTLSATVVAVQVDSGMLRSLVALCIATLISWAAASNLASKWSDPGLQNIPVMFAVRTLIALSMLFAGWVPQLDEGSAAFGYDPQRYYFEAEQLRRAGYSLDALPPINYTGILFYWAGIFDGIGHNPVAPLIVNSLTTLWALVVLMDSLYAYLPQDHRGHWALSFVLLIPELMWYDSIPSREMVCMAALTVLLLSILRILLPVAGAPLSHTGRAGALLAAGLIVFIRPTLLIPVCLLVISLILLKPGHIFRRPVGVAVIVAAVFAAFIFAPRIVGGLMGSADLSVSQLVDATQALERAREEGFTYSERSVAALLQSEDPLTLIALAPLRIAAYLAAPLPSISLDIASLFNGAWLAHQMLWTIISSLIYVLTAPFVCAAVASTVFPGQVRARFGGRIKLLALQLPFWYSIAAVALGNQIIHERYRISAILSFALVVWLGAHSSAKIIAWSFLVCALLSGSAVAAFFAYKGVV